MPPTPAKPAPAKPALAKPAPNAKSSKPTPAAKPALSEKPADLDLDALSKSLPASKTAKGKSSLDLSALASSLPKGKARRSLDLAALSSSLPRGRAKSAAKAGLDLAALSATLPPGKQGGAKGPPKPAASPSAGPPKGLPADARAALAAKLNRLWNPNCGVEGAGAVVVKVEMRLSADGRLTGPPRVVGRTGDAPSGVIEAAAGRALAAAARGEPYSELPRDAYDSWKDIIVNFNAKSACAGR